jgi:hypothetical protein
MKLVFLNGDQTQCSDRWTDDRAPWWQWTFPQQRSKEPYHFADIMHWVTLIGNITSEDDSTAQHRAIKQRLACSLINCAPVQISIMSCWICILVSGSWHDLEYGARFNFDFVMGQNVPEFVCERIRTPRRRTYIIPEDFTGRWRKGERCFCKFTRAIIMGSAEGVRACVCVCVLATAVQSMTRST